MFGCVAHKAIYGKSLTLTVSAHAQNYNMKTAALAAGWNGRSPLKLTVVVNSGVVIGSASTGSYAFDTDTGYPRGSSLTLVNNGTIAGTGGAASSGSGGPAFRAQAAISITNNGTIGGGGGGGGAGPAGSPGYGQGAGSGGLYGPTGGSGSNIYCPDEMTTTYGYAGSGGSLGNGGSGGGDSLGCQWSSGGGGAGACTSGNASITWTVAGARLGALN